MERIATKRCGSKIVFPLTCASLKGRPSVLLELELSPHDFISTLCRSAGWETLMYPSALTAVCAQKCLSAVSPFFFTQVRPGQAPAL